MKSGKKNKLKMNHKKSEQKLKKSAGPKNFCVAYGLGLKKVSLNHYVGDQNPVKLFFLNDQGMLNHYFFATECGL